MPSLQPPIGLDRALDCLNCMQATNMRAEQVIVTEAQVKAEAPPVSGTEFAITGMTCANCARHVTEAIQSVSAVSSAAVQLERNRATVRWEAGAEQDKAGVIHAVEEEGYGARVVEAQADEHSEPKLSGWQLNLWVGLLGTVPLMLGEWVFGLG